MRQLELFAGGGPRIDPTFATLVRTRLDHGAWIDHAPGWVSDHDTLFERLSAQLAWRHETRKMYDHVVEVPRLLAHVPRDPLVEEMCGALAARYGEAFVHTTAALYRDGGDSVAFHGDTTARDMLEAVVATVSLGAPRRFLMKPTEGGRSIALPLGRGDLVVMGGTFQRTWRHAIPKVASAAPRIALMFRPAWGRSYEAVPGRASAAPDRPGLRRS